VDPQIRIKDADKVLRAFKKVRRELPKELVRELRSLGREVQADAAARFAPINAESAAGFSTSVSKLGRVRVQQRKRKTTGDHPEYGRAQMTKALIPALNAKRGHVEKGLEDLIERVIRDNGLK
jgi:hypothetical protein